MSNLIQQTDEWLAFRRGKIGASDAPVIMGVSPWSTPHKLWLEKLSFGEKRKTSAMQRGIELEETARDKFEEMTGLFVIPQVVEHKSIEWMIASLDGITIEKDAIVEIKCSGKEDHASALAGKIPEKYFPQVQHQLEVCELEKAYYFSYNETKSVVLEVFRDDKYIKKMIQIEADFWNCLQDFIPPAMTEKDYIQKGDDVWNAAANEWLLINRKLKAMEPREKELRELLISMANKQNSIGGGVKVSRMIRKGSVDYSRIPGIQSVNLDQYRKDPVECWKIIGDRSE